MAMPENIKFERRDQKSATAVKARKRELSARRDAVRVERQVKIDREELEARTFLAQKEAEFRGMRSPGDEAAKQILTTYNAVVADGRHIALFLEHPQAAAELVKTELSNEAAEWLRTGGSLRAALDFASGPGELQNVAVVAVAVIVVVLEVTHAPNEEFVLDPAGELKF